MKAKIRKSGLKVIGKQPDEKIKHLASFPQLNPNPIVELDRGGRVIFSNLAMIKTLKRLGASKQIKLFLPKDITRILKNLNAGKKMEIIRDIRIGESFFEETVLTLPELKVVRIYARDITKRKKSENLLQEAHDQLEEKVNQRTRELEEANALLSQQIAQRQAAEKKKRLSNAILKLLAKTSSRKEYLEKITKLMQALSHCRCAGIRVLDEEGNIPYESFLGFSREFWQAENWLSVACHHCACTRVMAEAPEPEDAQAMTQGGSFRLDNALKFISIQTEKGKEKYRGACIKNGFLSIAVIPIRYKDRVIGGIHLADENENRLPLELVESIESVTDLIGEGVYKFMLMEKFQESNQLLMRAKQLSDIGSLAATVAHELRNPLGVIRTAAYNIKRKAQNPLLEGHFVNIEKKIIEADQIINNLLFYSRLKTPHIENARLFDILDDCIESAKNKYSKSKVKVFKKIHAIKDDFIEADPLQLGELFINILSNAYDAVGEDAGKIEVSARNDNSGNVIVEIKDSGLGMDDEELKRIFEPFFTTKAKGTGLGLTVCKQIIEMHNGVIKVESVKNAGTLIKVSLPLRRKIAP